MESATSPHKSDDAVVATAAAAAATGDSVELTKHDSPQQETHHVTTTATAHPPDLARQRSRTGSNATHDSRRLLVTDAPPFWTSPTRPGRSISVVSYSSLNRPSAILLEDHSSEQNEQTQSCWAQSVRVDDYVIVSGRTGVGAYVVWHCTVGTLQGGDFTIRKRYSEFDQLRLDLVRAFPHAAAMIPQLPRKSVVSRFRPKFLEQRRAGLSHFLSCILLNPEFAASPILKDFIFY